MNPTTADVVRARALTGNAVVTAAMGGRPAGEGAGPASWRGQMLLAGQNLVGNQAVATHGRTLPSPTTPDVPGPGTRKAPPPKTPPTPVAKATPPAAPRPDQKDPGKAPQEGQDKGTAKGAAKKEATGPRSPGTDPKFQALRKDVGTKKRSIGSSHPPAKAEAGAAQAASVPPSDDREARGKAAHAEDMDAAQPKEFNKTEFIKAVEDAVAKRAPKNLDEADKFGDSGKAEEVKQEVQGKVGEGKESSAKEIADTTHETPKPAPDEKPVVPLAADKVPGRPGTPDPNQAAPDRLPASATDMSAGPAQVDRQMADAKVTEEQLSFDNAREPRFDKAVKDKKTMEAHSETAPGQLRAGEGREIAQVKKVAATRGAAAMAAMHATRVTTGKNVGAGKVATKSSDEEKRAQVTAILQKVFDKTKGDVEKILSDLDKTVDDQFTRDEKRARDRFTAEHEQGMADYKHRRYSGPLGWTRWIRDLFADLPEEANRIYETAKEHYLTAMRQVISDIADTIERELRRAKDCIATGRKDLKAAVDKLPADLKAIGREAARDFEGKFDELRDTVDDKGTELVDTLATKYTDAVKSVDDEIAAEKEKNKGLVSKAADAIGGVIRTIMELGSLLMGVLRKAVSAVGAILKDPIGFLGNLVTGVGGGLKLFAKNAGRHLEQGVLAWLLGAGASAGLLLPPNFDVLGILMMLAALLGLSWANIRARLVRKVPEQAVTAAETAIPLVAETRKRGVAGMWSDLKSRVGDLKKDLIKNLVSYLLPTIVIAGITWIVSLFNPASAFIRACKMIIDIIRFIVTQGRQIIEFVNTVLDAVIAIAKGGTGGVPALVESALAKSIPVLIGALAAILGVGGIAGKVRQIFQQLARPVNRAIDWVIDKIVGLVKKLWAKIKPRKPRKPRRSKKLERPTDRKPSRPRKPKKWRPDEAKTKKPEDQDIKAPMRLVEPAVITITKISPGLAEEIQEAVDDRTIHKASGTAKQVTRDLLAKHRDARYDKTTRTLTLPKVSDGGAGSLSGLGSRMADQTGVSKVTLKKQENKAEIWGWINPKTPLVKIRGLPTDEAILRLAIAQVGIIQFLKNMAEGRCMTVTQGLVTGKIGMSKFETVWAKPKGKNYVKDKFRDVSDGNHEWIPTNYILKVTKRARDFAEGTKWIDLQNELRTETFRVVYSPAKQQPKVVQDQLPSDTNMRKYNVPQGHVGAVYYPTVGNKNKQDTGSANFHKDLRSAFDNATNVKNFAQAANVVAQQWAWNGSRMPYDIHPSCVDKNNNQVTAKQQGGNVTSITDLFNKYT